VIETCIMLSCVAPWLSSEYARMANMTTQEKSWLSLFNSTVLTYSVYQASKGAGPGQTIKALTSP